MATSFTSVQINAEDGTPLQGDLYKPTSGRPPYPIIFLFHGGGWVGGNRQMNTDQALDWQKAGFITIPAEYRFCGKTKLPGQTLPAFYPAQGDDVRAWIRYGRSIKQGNGKVGAWGSSAGGNNALTAAFMGEPGVDRPDFIVSMSAAYDFSDESSLADTTKPLMFGVNVPQYCHCDPPLETACLKAASPISQIGALGSIPLFLSQGELDNLPRNQLPLYIAELDRLSYSPYQAEIVPRGGHGFSHWLRPLSNGTICRDAAIDFVKNALYVMTDEV